jgi:DNA-directed RNA polymerase subunit K/omega
MGTNPGAPPAREGVASVTKDTKRALRSLAFAPRPGQNKYELVIIAAREARHLNELSRLTGEPITVKVTALALDRVLREEVPFTYEEPALNLPEA